MSVYEAIERIRTRAIIELTDNNIPLPLALKSPTNIFSTEATTTVSSPKGKTFIKSAIKENIQTIESGVHSLRILSQNLWGIPHTPKCTERAEEFVYSLKDGDWSLVVLQEVWHRRERDLIIKQARNYGLNYHHYFQPAVGFPVPIGHDSFGTGLLVLSKYPIVNVFFHAFVLSGRPYALHESDFIANKGVGLLRIALSPTQEIDVYATHLIANYNDKGKPGPGDRYIYHRTGQAYELSQFIAATRRNKLMVICGDFNSPPDCLVVRVPRQLLQLRDAYLRGSSKKSASEENSDPEEGLTFGTRDNKYSYGDFPMRMDYILYNYCKDENTDDNRTWECVDSSVYKGFFKDTNGEVLPLSDHFGVQAHFVFQDHQTEERNLNIERMVGEVETEEDSTETETDDTDSNSQTLLLGLDNVGTKKLLGLKALRPSKYANFDLLREIHSIILEGREYSVGQRAKHLRRSALSFCILFLLLWSHALGYEMSSFLLFGGSAILLLVGIFFYIVAFFFGTLECSTFTEVANEVKLHAHSEVCMLK